MQNNILLADEIDDRLKTYEIVPNAEVYAGILARLDIVDISDVTGAFSVQRVHEVIKISGRLTYQVVQKCIVSLDPVKSAIDTEFTVFFTDKEEELAEDLVVRDDMAEPIENGQIDLNALLIEQISLSLPDYPRADHAEFEDHIEAPEALKPIEERTHRPFEKLLQAVKDDD